MFKNFIWDKAWNPDISEASPRIEKHASPQEWHVRTGPFSIQEKCFARVKRNQATQTRRPSAVFELGIWKRWTLKWMNEWILKHKLPKGRDLSVLFIEKLIFEYYRVNK